MAKKLSKLWKIVLGSFAIYFCLSLFHSSTVLVGLTKDGVSHSYTMTRKPSTWEIFWGKRALDLWKYSEGHEDLAIVLVKGKTLIGFKKKRMFAKNWVCQLEVTSIQTSGVTS